MSEAKKAYDAIAMLHATNETKGCLDSRVCELHHHSWIQPGKTMMFEITHHQEKHKIILFRDGTGISLENEEWRSLCQDNTKAFVNKLADKFSEDSNWLKNTTAVLCLRDTMKTLNPHEVNMIYESFVSEPKPVRGFDL